MTAARVRPACFPQPGFRDAFLLPDRIFRSALVFLPCHSGISTDGFAMFLLFQVYSLSRRENVSGEELSDVCVRVPVRVRVCVSTRQLCVGK